MQHDITLTDTLVALILEAVWILFLASPVPVRSVDFSVLLEFVIRENDNYFLH